MESKFQELEDKSIEIENWLNANPEHPRLAEGEDKLRAVLRDMNTEYCREHEPSQERLF